MSNSITSISYPFLMFLVTNHGLICYYDRLYLAPAVTNTLKARNVVSDWLIKMNQCSLATRLVSRRVSPTLAWNFFVLVFCFVLFCFLSQDVCQPMVGSVLKDSWWTNQERAVMPSFSKNTPRATVVLMHCHCQIMLVHVAPRKSIHFGEIFDWAFTDGMTTFVNMWLCNQQALNFCPVNFYYFTVWCLQSLCYSRRKLIWVNENASRGVHKYCKRLI